MEIEQFLSHHALPPLVLGCVEDDSSRVIKAYIISHNSTYIKVLHLQTEYLIAKSDIISVKIPNYIFCSTKGGQPAELAVHADAIIRHAFEVTAGRFFSDVPFAFLVPSWADSIERSHTNLCPDAEWLFERGLLDRLPTAERPLLAAEGTMTIIDTDQPPTDTWSGTATGIFPDISIDHMDSDDKEEHPATNDGLKNDEGY